MSEPAITVALSTAFLGILPIIWWATMPEKQREHMGCLVSLGLAFLINAALILLYYGRP